MGVMRSDDLGLSCSLPCSAQHRLSQRQPLELQVDPHPPLHLVSSLAMAQLLPLDSLQQPLLSGSLQRLLPLVNLPQPQHLGRHKEAWHQVSVVHSNQESARLQQEQPAMHQQHEGKSL